MGLGRVDFFKRLNDLLQDVEPAFPNLSCFIDELSEHGNCLQFRGASANLSVSPSDANNKVCVFGLAFVSLRKVGMWGTGPKSFQ